jgi:hypothetical protein
MPSTKSLSLLLDTLITYCNQNQWKISIIESVISLEDSFPSSFVVPHYAKGLVKFLIYMTNTKIGMRHGALHKCDYQFSA